MENVNNKVIANCLHICVSNKDKKSNNIKFDSHIGKIICMALMNEFNNKKQVIFTLRQSWVLTVKYDVYLKVLILTRITTAKL